MAGLTNCPQCGAPLDAGLRQCKYCNAVLVQQAQPQPPAPPRYNPPPPQQVVYVQQTPPPPPRPLVPRKSKVAAGLLAIFLGGIGVHHFYLGKWGLGILYLLFCWTYVPAIVGLIEGIVYLATDDAKFAARHGGYC